MRLRRFERDTIVSTFQSLFPLGDTLWLFGSRVKDNHRGGDIDLFIESTLDHESLFSLKIQFLNDLKTKMGDQKIDIVVRSLQDEEILAIYEEARKTGVKLVMNDLERLQVAIAICDVHAQRIQQSLDRLTTTQNRSALQSGFSCPPFPDRSPSVTTHQFSLPRSEGRYRRGSPLPASARLSQRHWYLHKSLTNSS